MKATAERGTGGEAADDGLEFLGARPAVVTSDFDGHGSDPAY